MRVDYVIPPVPVRQWVLSFPIPLRILLAAHPELLLPVLQIVHRLIATFLIKQAGAERSEADTGAVTLIQRFGSAANLNTRPHGLVLDGAYQPTEREPVFHAGRAPRARPDPIIPSTRNEFRAYAVDRLLIVLGIPPDESRLRNRNDLIQPCTDHGERSVGYALHWMRSGATHLPIKRIGLMRENIAGFSGFTAVRSCDGNRDGKRIVGVTNVQHRYDPRPWLRRHAAPDRTSRAALQALASLARSA